MKDIVVAGGCFWCIEADFIKLDGVVEVYPGYIGGLKESANYQDVSSSCTRHKEACLIEYDENIIDFKSLIIYFFTCIDPTNERGQFVDLGPQYTTAVYYNNEEEECIIRSIIDDINRSTRFKDDIVTEVNKRTKFYRAEDYHHKFYIKNKVHYNRYRKVSKRDEFIKSNWEDIRNGF